MTKVLTIRQPHAQLVVVGAKPIETRSWSTKYRGPLIIHAGKHQPERGDYGDWYCDRADIYESPPHIAPAQPTTAGWPGGSSKLTLLRREWGMADDHGQGLYYSLPLGFVVASCVLADVVPIVGDAHLATQEDERYVIIHDGAHLRRSWGIYDDATAQLPFGDFTPGRFAWLLEDVKPTTDRCPWCWGSGRRLLTDPVPPHFVTKATNAGPCRACDGAQVCDPIPAKGHQGLWEWTP